MSGEAGGQGDAGEPAREPGKRRRRAVRQERRVPAWVVVPLAMAAGYAVSGIPGGIFGLLAGLALWWSRR